MKRWLAVAFAIILPLEARTSGSSTVTATGAHVSVSLESVRKIFAGGEGEGDWHREWVEEHQPVVDAALPKLEAALSTLAAAEGISLAPWSDDLPEAWTWAPPDNPHSVEMACTAGCRARFQLWSADASLPHMFEAEVALAAPVSPEALSRVLAGLAASLATETTP